MALAEARAAWQRTANRCFVQEDAKRAPKLACCSAVPPSVKQADTPTSASGGQDVASSISMPFNLNASHSNLSPNSKWWLHVQPNHGYQKGMMDEHSTSFESSMEAFQMPKSSEVLARSGEDSGLIDQTPSYNNITTGDKKDFGAKEDAFRTLSSWILQDALEVKEDVGELKVEALVPEFSKNINEPCFDSKSSWVGVDKNTPWWRIADTDELASLVAQSSFEHIENCDLPRPQNTHVKKDVDARDGISGSSLDPKLWTGSHHHCNDQLHTANLTSERACPILEGQPVSSEDETLRDIPTHERTLEMQTSERDASKAQLMEALRHSQTRAREAETAAKQACAEKEHIVRLVFRQASQLFAYKQWLQLLQLESMYLQFINNTSQSVSPAPQRTRKFRKNWDTSSSGKWGKHCSPQYEASKNAVVFALGLGLAGAGFLLGWTIGWMLPTW